MVRDHRPWAQFIARRLPAVDKPVVVELAAGPGFLLLELGAIVQGAELIAVDDAPAMLEIQAEEAKRAGRAMRSVQGRAQDTGLSEASADVVLCKNLLNCMEGKDAHEAVLREMHRLLRPGGLAVLLDFDDAGPSLAALALKTFVRFQSGAEFARDFGEAWNRRLHAQDILRLVQRTGFEDTWYHRRLITFMIEGRRAAS